MGLGSIVGAIGGALANPMVAGAALSGAGTMYQNYENKKAAQRQMDFQSNMSNTAYQRGMTDMRKAGLNPLLAAKLGGASTPGGAMPVMQNIGSAMIDGGTRAAQTTADVGVKEAQVELIEAQAAVQRVDETLKNLKIPREQIYNQLWLFAKEGLQEAKRKGESFMDWITGSNTENKISKWLDEKGVGVNMDDIITIMKVLSTGQTGLIRKMMEGQ